MRWIAFALLAACGGRAVAPAPSARRVAAAEPSEPSDSDGDGVPDVCDWCPREPGINRADHPSGRGCPYIDCFGGDDFVYSSPPIRFERDQTAPPALAELAAKMRADRANERFVLVGHAAPDEKDPEGTAAERARNVMAALVAKGVDEKRLEAHGAGATRPQADAASTRRVDIDITRWCGRDRAWNESVREVVDVPKGELAACPPALRL